ncbi:TetR/AcrR family transcriptional regulator [Hyphomicrobium sp.]|uniref:TetR/AcrR family transcriptional regulator n=1 Tax=Hyphomicrobium sp. TaxID=82 RepID=UPI0025C0B5A5|nr:TetR/AcrR family transcriptional regulator [Hyphomicrobium sp.]
MTNRSQMTRPATRPTMKQSPDGSAKRTRQHLPAAERERQIVEAAADFFAEHGLEGQTRELAKTLGITHSAIFRYFPSKEALIERVYDHVFLSRWDPDWRGLLSDRSQPLEQRLIRFYHAYAERIFDAQWMRIFMFAGLKGHPMTNRYVSLIRTQLIRPACGELRAELGLPTLASLPITAREEEAFWALHGMVFYLGIRKFIYGMRTQGDQSQIIADDVRALLAGAPFILRAACGTSG